MKGLNSEWQKTITENTAIAKKDEVSLTTQFNEKLGTLEMEIKGVKTSANKSSKVYVALVGDYKESVKDYLEVGSFESMSYQEAFKDLVQEWLSK